MSYTWVMVAIGVRGSLNNKAVERTVAKIQTLGVTKMVIVERRMMDAVANLRRSYLPSLSIQDFMKPTR